MSLKKLFLKGPLLTSDKRMAKSTVDAVRLTRRRLRHIAAAAALMYQSFNTLSAAHHVILQLNVDFF